MLVPNLSKLSKIESRLPETKIQISSSLISTKKNWDMLRQIVFSLRSNRSGFSLSQAFYKKPLNVNYLRSHATISKISSKEKKITPFGFLLLIIPGTTFCLGCWQVKRKIWKENLIKELDEKISMTPVHLPENLDEVSTMEYQPVIVKGHFIHEKELHLGPRSFVRPNETEPRSSLFTSEPSIGYLVITPFKLSGREETILINRGWVPKTHLNPQRRLAGQVKDEIELTGIVRRGESRPQFSPEHKGDTYLYRDLFRMCSETGASPIFLDATYASTVPGGPVGGQTRISLRNDHLSYLITWFCLSAATSWAWYRQIVQRKPF